MPITIGSNIASVRAVRQLDGSSATLSRVFERLSSGARINRASDDAAGLSVASQLSSKARVLSRARLNLSDASSLISIADGALDQVSQILTRMQELAAQAASGTLGGIQRRSLDKEYQQLDKELQRIADTTRFNGINLLDGGRTQRNFVNIAQDTGFGLSLHNTSLDGTFVLYEDNQNLDSYIVKNVETGEETSFTTPSGFSASSMRLLANGDVVYSADGTGMRALFHYRRAEGTTRQLTTSVSALDASYFEVSQDGSTVAFVSRTMFADGGSALSNLGTDSLYRLTTLNLETGIVRQVADGDLNVLSFLNIRISSDGRYVARQGTSNSFAFFDTQSALGSSSTIIATGSVAPTLRSVNSDGKIYLYSAGDLFGQNSTGINQFFEYDILTGASRRTTNFTSSVSIGSDTVINSLSDYLFFTSTANHTGLNPDGVRQVYRLNMRDGALTQTTSATTSSNIFSGTTTRLLSADGSRLLALRSSGTSLDMLDLAAANTTLNFEAGFGATGSIGAEIGSLFSTVRGLGAYSITSRSGGSYVLDRMRSAIQAVSSARGVIGAAQSRINIAEALTVGQRDEVVGAARRITDADIADESSALIRGQILQQVGAALLAQANQQPQVALLLLGQR